MIEIESKGSFKNTEAFLNHMSKGDIFDSLNNYGQQGVDALAGSTPTDTGFTASSWMYEIDHSWGSYSITWSNTNVENGLVIAILLQYGHGTGTGGYVAGRDYINPAVQPIFDRIADDVWKEVVSS